MENQKENKASLHDMLTEETENKAPTELKGKLWNFEDAEELEETPENNPDPDEKKPTKKLNPDEKKDKESKQIASAETLTASIDILTDLGFGLAINNRFRNNFTDEQFEHAQEIQDKDIDSLDENDINLKNRFERQNLKREKKLKELSFEPDEIERLNKIFLNYFKITNKELDPTILLIMGITGAILDKARTTFMD